MKATSGVNQAYRLAPQEQGEADKTDQAKDQMSDDDYGDALKRAASGDSF